MGEQSYLQWLVRETPTTWWHDSGEPGELAFGLEHLASGVTTNPVLSARALAARPTAWLNEIDAVDSDMPPEKRAEERVRIVVSHCAHELEPVYERTEGADGYVCAQVDPNRPGDRDVMLGMARRFASFAPNIAVKLPVTAAGLDVLEDCIAEGITITATVSFTVPQVLAIAERYRAGIARARESGITPGHCFSVIMIGRLDDYLRDVAHDQGAAVSEQDIRWAGLAVTKRAYAIYQERGYEAKLLIAAQRGTYHINEVAGSEMIMSIHPKTQAMLFEPGVPRVCGIDNPVPADVVARLETIPDFRRAYEPDGMTPEEFLGYGATQRTLTQFAEIGWNVLES
jgi:transaldolase